MFLELLNPINDVTTTPDAPPIFMAIGGLSVHRGKSLEYPAKFAAIQAKLYPDLNPLNTKIDADTLFKRALKLATDRGWQILHEGEKSRRIEAVVTTPLLRFKDDVVIEIRGSEVHMRSRSRVGRGDLGANYKRIRSFLDELKAKTH